MATAAGLCGLIGGGLIEAGLTWTGLAVAALAMAAFHYQEELTEYLERGPAVDVVEYREQGLSDREVQEFNVLHNEYKKIQEEQRKKMEKKAKKQGKGGGKSLNKR